MSFNPKEHLISLKGKDYLQIMWRLVWFREEKPLWCIDTHLEELADNHAIFSAKIYDENGIQKSAGYGSESIKDFKDFIEKAETKAVGRALAMLGYGTQFAPELDEEERIADSPVERKTEDPKEKTQTHKCENCNTTIMPHKNKNGTEVDVAQLVQRSKSKYGKVLCVDCAKKAEKKEQTADAELDDYMNSLINDKGGGNE